MDSKRVSLDDKPEVIRIPKEDIKIQAPGTPGRFSISSFMNFASYKNRRATRDQAGDTASNGNCDSLSNSPAHVEAGANNNNNNSCTANHNMVTSKDKPAKYVETGSSQDRYNRQQASMNRKSADWTSSSRRSGNSVRGTSRTTEITIIIMGSARVGKSSLVNQFLHRIFRKDYKPTCDDSHWIEYDATKTDTLSENNEEQAKSEPDGSITGTLLLKLIDSSGSREFLGMRKLYQQTGDAFVLVVAVDDPSSFEEVKIMRQEIAEQNTKRAPVIVVLNKMDLRQSTEHSAGQLNPEDVRRFATLNQCPLVEASATKFEDVAEVFKTLLQHNRIIPSAAQLKYRRKSMPVNSTTDLFMSNSNGQAENAAVPLMGNGGRHMNYHHTNHHHGHKYTPNRKSLKDIEETEVVEEEKHSSCVIC